jgi:hypothetical protein
MEHKIPRDGGVAKAVTGDAARTLASESLLQYLSYPRREREVVKLQEIEEYDTHQQTIVLR